MSSQSKPPAVGPFEIRPLTTGDLNAIAPVHLAAFPKSAMSSLGEEAVRRYYLWQLTGPHKVTALIANANSRCAGFVVGGSFCGATSGFIWANRAYLAWRVLTHPWLLKNPLFRQRLRLSANIVRWVRRQKRKEAAAAASGVPQSPAIRRTKTFSILSLAVHPTAQGAGVGRRLMQDMETIGLAGGFDVMYLSVSPENEQAVRFYERLGWQRAPRDGSWTGDMVKHLTASTPVR
jgi:ribosomal protein S18 acetylase RimI-like enzyme